MPPAPDDDPALDGVPDDRAGATVPAGAPPGGAPRPASVRTLLLGAVVAVVAAFGILLAAGSGGAAGVVVAAAVESAFVYALYRYSPAP